MTRLSLRGGLAALRAARPPRSIVIPTMGAAREWMAQGPAGPLDFVYVPSSMGHATSVGLGLALARPDRPVIVVNGDGSMLMNLGSLVTIAALAPKNLIVVVCANGVYEVTGAQPIPGAGTVDFVALARGAGFREAHRFDRLDRWEAELPAVLALAGPVLVELAVEPVRGIPGPKSPGPAAARARDFIAALDRD